MIQVAFGAADILFGSLIAGSLAGLAVLGHLRAIGNREDENKTLRRRLSRARSKLADAAELQAIADKKDQMLREVREQLRESRAMAHQLEARASELFANNISRDEMVMELLASTDLEELTDDPHEYVRLVNTFTPEMMTRRTMERVTLAQLYDYIAHAEGPLVKYAEALGIRRFAPDTEFNPNKLPDGFPKKVIDDLESLPYRTPAWQQSNPELAAGESPRITAAESARMTLPDAGLASPAKTKGKPATDTSNPIDMEAMLKELDKAIDRLEAGEPPPVSERPAKPKTGGRK